MMNFFHQILPECVMLILNTSFLTIPLIAVVSFISLLSRKRVPFVWHSTLWFIVIVRLLFPLSLESQFSYLNLLPSYELEIATSHPVPDYIAVYRDNMHIVAPVLSNNPAPQLILESKSSIWMTIYDNSYVVFCIIWLIAITFLSYRLLAGYLSLHCLIRHSTKLSEINEL